MDHSIKSQKKRIPLAQRRHRRRIVLVRKVHAKRTNNSTRKDSKAQKKSRGKFQ
jgi:hypothetical protein